MSSFRLNRRAFLRAGAFTVGLPLLDAMLDGRGGLLGAARAATGAPPVRLINFFWPNGVNANDFFSATSTARAALGAAASEVNLLTGLHNNVIGNFQEGGALQPLGSHGCGGAGFTTAVHVTAAGAGGPSIDQVAAAALGGQTKFRSLVVSGQTRIYLPSHFHNQSWVGVNNAAEPTRDPLKVYDLLFGTPATPPTSQPSQLLRDRKSVLDFAQRDAARLNTRLGAADKARLDEHLTAIRALEQQLAAVTPPPSACTTPARPTAPGADIAKRASLYSKLIARAFACDLTRFVTFQLTDAMYEGALIPDAAGANDHELSHGTDAASIALIIKSTAFKMAQLAGLITELKSVSEPTGGTLLDNSVIFATSEIADSAAHGWQNMPVLVAGGGGGHITGGRKLSYSGKSVGDLFATLLTTVGVPTTKFGDGTGTLPGLVS
ncbi:MAG: DUF1552 domain-containing protein [Myxococcaceae bacterium]|nr:DUF1552 domain-containing protein [Myxococcaceae bacterium]